MKLFIPPLGTRLRLLTEWTFDLHHEYRNETLFSHLGLEMDKGHWNGSNWVTHGPAKVTLPAGTLLTVDRIYIRKGQDDFYSVSFLAPGLKGAHTYNYFPPAGGYEKRQGQRVVRFWAKLADVNTLDVDVVEA